MRDLLNPHRGRGKPSRRTEREIKEIRNPNHSRTELHPFGQIEVADEMVALAGEDEWRTMFDPDVHPKPPKPRDEPVCDDCGVPFDIMGDTPPAEDEFDLLGDDPGTTDLLDIRL